MNFSSDHVEPIKADRGTHLHPDLFHFFRSLFISAPRTGLYPFYLARFSLSAFSLFSTSLSPARFSLLPIRGLPSFFSLCLCLCLSVCPSLSLSLSFLFRRSCSLFCNPVPLPATPHPRHPHTVPSSPPPPPLPPRRLSFFFCFLGEVVFVAVQPRSFTLATRWIFSRHEAV